LKCLVFLVASITCACPAWAAPDSGTPPGLFDPPQAVTRIEGPNLTAAQSFECTWYSDFMLRETETDSPGRGQSYFVQQPANGVPRACPGAHNSSDIPLDRGDTAFMGRKGKFLFYEATDAPSAEPFSIWHVPDGRRIYSDSMNATSGLKAISLVGEVLHLTYVRAYAANCSLLKDSASCWARSMKAGHFARAIAAQPPPVNACALSYRTVQAPANDQSIILYTVEMVLTPDGKTTVLSRGQTGCEPAG
jgi:hypothetical protein